MSKLLRGDKEQGMTTLKLFWPSLRSRWYLGKKIIRFEVKPVTQDLVDPLLGANAKARNLLVELVVSQEAVVVDPPADQHRSDLLTSSLVSTNLLGGAQGSQPDHQNQHPQQH